jgi:Protein of unknown function VcgC/VcgE (DUF2780)
MEEFLSKQLGGKVSTAQIKQGIGSALAYLKSKLGADDFAKIQSAIPGADKYIADAEADNKIDATATATTSGTSGDSGGTAALMGAAMSMFGGSGGSGSATKSAEGGGDSSSASTDTLPELLTQLNKAGIDPTKVPAFLSGITKYMDEKGIDVSNVLGGSSGSDLAGKASSFLSSFGGGNKD